MIKEYIAVIMQKDKVLKYAEAIGQEANKNNCVGFNDTLKHRIAFLFDDQDNALNFYNTMRNFGLDPHMERCWRDDKE